MELKSFYKPWLSAIKGVFLILFGIGAIFQITGSIKILSILFIVPVIAMSILFLNAGTLFVKSKSRSLLIYMKNVIGMHLIINVLLSLLFAYFFYMVLGNFTPQSLLYIGIIVLITGVINVISSNLLRRLQYRIIV